MQQKESGQEIKARPNKYHDVGMRGRKTGWMPKQNIRKDSDGLDNVDDFFASDTDESPARSKSRLSTASKKLEFIGDEENTTPVRASPSKAITSKKQNLAISVREKNFKLAQKQPQIDTSSISARKDSIQSSRDGKDRIEDQYEYADSKFQEDYQPIRRSVLKTAKSVPAYENTLYRPSSTSRRSIAPYQDRQPDDYYYTTEYQPRPILAPIDRIGLYVSPYGERFKEVLIRKPLSPEEAEELDREEEEIRRRNLAIQYEREQISQPRYIDYQEEADNYINDYAIPRGTSINRSPIVASTRSVRASLSNRIDSSRRIPTAFNRRQSNVNEVGSPILMKHVAKKLSRSQENLIEERDQHQNEKQEGVERSGKVATQRKISTIQQNSRIIQDSPSQRIPSPSVPDSESEDRVEFKDNRMKSKGTKQRIVQTSDEDDEVAGANDNNIRQLELNSHSDTEKYRKLDSYKDVRRGEDEIVETFVDDYNEPDYGGGFNQDEYDTRLVNDDDISEGSVVYEDDRVDEPSPQNDVFNERFQSDHSVSADEDELDVEKQEVGEMVEEDLEPTQVIKSVKKARSKPTKKPAEKKALKQKSVSTSEKRVALSAQKMQYTKIKATENEDGRPVRNRSKPLNYWENEKNTIKLKLDPEAGMRVPYIDQQVRTEHTSPVRAVKKKAARTKKVKVEAAVKEDESFEYQDNTDITVMNPLTAEEEDRPLIVPYSAISLKDVNKGSFLFSKTFAEGAFISSGYVILKNNGEKPNKSSKDAVLIFLVIDGLVEVTIHKTTVKVGSGTQFSVPRGNQYRLQNAGKKEAKLFFVQGKEVDLGLQVDKVDGAEN